MRTIEMLKTALNMFVGALVAASVSFALAVTGNVPQNGFSAIDGTWLLGLSAGTNYTYQSGITAAGTSSQATATQLPSGVYIMEIDTAASNSGVALPPCVPGTQSILYNNGAQTVQVYPSIANNLLTGIQDTINNATSLNSGSGLATHTSIAFACAKAGNWNAS
jgi:hypothetical protein